VPGDDPVVGADQHRVGPAKLADGGRHLGDLLVGMDAGVARTRQQLLDAPELDLRGKMHQLIRVTTDNRE